MTSQTEPANVLLEKVEAVDKKLRLSSGAIGSLGALCPEAFNLARVSCIASVLKHAGVIEKLDDPDGQSDSDLSLVWSSALRLVEDGLRAAVAACGLNSKREWARKFCEGSEKSSRALLRFEPCTRLNGDIDETVKNAAKFHSWFVAGGDADAMEKELLLARRRGLLRLIAMREAKHLLENLTDSGSVVPSIPLECASVSLPRLLGRASSSSSHRNLDTTGTPPELELSGHFLEGLAGCGRATLESLTSSVHQMVQSLGHVMLQALSHEHGLESNDDSLLLALLAVFTITIRGTDVVGMIQQSQIIEGLRLILSKKRISLSSEVRDPEKAVTDKEYLANQITHISRRDVSRAVLRSAVSAAHLITFQVPRKLVSGSAASVSTKLCVDLMMGELSEAVACVETETGQTRLLYERNETGKDYELWLEHAVEGTKEGKRRRMNKKRQGAVIQLLESGTLTSPIVGIVKPSKQGKSGASSSASESRKKDFTRTEDVLQLLRPHLHQHLSHWLRPAL